MISAYIMPHPPAAVEEVGYKELDKMRATLDAYGRAAEMIAEDKPETVIVISPHAPMYRDAFYIAAGEGGTGSMAAFGAPTAGLSAGYDRELAREIVKLCKEQDVPVVYSSEEAEVLDHGATVPLLFIAKKYVDFGILRISPTYLSSDVLLHMGKIIERAAAHIGRRVTILASGDLSHRLKEDGPYGFNPAGPVFDEKITNAMKNFDIASFCSLCDDHAFLDEAGQCGTPAFTMMAGALMDNYKVTPKFLSYEGPFGVGYAICAYKCEDICVSLARKSLETFIRTGERYLPMDDTVDDTADETMGDTANKDVAKIKADGAGETGLNIPDWMLTEEAGVFVSLKKRGELRGCIGTFLPTTPCIAMEICRLAVDSGTQDPRFLPVTEDELDELVYSVDVLSPPVPAKKEDLDEKRFGVIVSKGYRRGLLLPNLEGVDSVDEQLRISLLKGRISPDEDYDIERFTVERHT